MIKIDELSKIKYFEENIINFENIKKFSLKITKPT